MLMPLRIAVVEADEDLRDLFVMFLAKQSYEVKGLTCIEELAVAVGRVAWRVHYGPKKLS